MYSAFRHLVTFLHQLTGKQERTNHEYERVQSLSKFSIVDNALDVTSACIFTFPTMFHVQRGIMRIMHDGY